jgi:hypothetical protein
MTIAQRAWNEVTPTTISNCFKHCKFVGGECDDTDHLEDHNALAGNETDVYDQLSQHMTELTDAITLMQEYVAVYENVETCAKMNSSEIAQLVSKTAAEEPLDEDFDECDVEILPPSKTEVMASLDILKRHLMCVNSSQQHLLMLNKLQKLTEESFSAAKQQTLITDYIGPS